MVWVGSFKRILPTKASCAFPQHWDFWANQDKHVGCQLPPTKNMSMFPYFWAERSFGDQTKHMFIVKKVSQCRNWFNGYDDVIIIQHRIHPKKGRPLGRKLVHEPHYWQTGCFVLHVLTQNDSYKTEMYNKTHLLKLHIRKKHMNTYLFLFIKNKTLYSLYRLS